MFPYSLILTNCVTIYSCSFAVGTKTTEVAPKSRELEGHEYQLLLVQVPGGKGNRGSDFKFDDQRYNKGRVIFVGEGKSAIRLYNSDEVGGFCEEEGGIDAGDYGVVDCDATDSMGFNNDVYDGKGASFCLPDPFPNTNSEGSTEMAAYRIDARVVGKPGGVASIALCADIEEENLDDYCGVEAVLTTSNKGFTDVSQELLTIAVCDGQNTKTKSYGLFDDELSGEYWEYDITNPGVKVAQLRFYITDSGVTRNGAQCPTR